jgi:hypothetical protein
MGAAASDRPEKSDKSADFEEGGPTHFLAHILLQPAATLRISARCLQDGSRRVKGDPV